MDDLGLDLIAALAPTLVKPVGESLGRAAKVMLVVLLENEGDDRSIREEVGFGGHCVVEEGQWPVLFLWRLAARGERMGYLPKVSLN